jgi:DNA-binding NarL/FixJ family response regulator
MEALMIRVLLVDDQSVIRQAVSSWLGIEPDVAVVGEAESGQAALDLASALRPDVVLMDIDMPVMDGLAATSALHDVSPETAVVILSMHDDSSVRARAQEAGAVAFVSKHQALDELVQAIRSAVRPNTPSILAAGSA